ncbi:502_t:CDS:1 [Paraglomus occultum]|uniref:502_t:CDS:1 n=1 Tax=Paraglomus occultum TaxID=144539 RepID=A0A9N9FYP2_9GLOM|nr:502_t:CDS:1 [Paraglomus occultum]
MFIKADIYKKADAVRRSPQKEVRKRLQILARKKLKCELSIVQRRRSIMPYGMRKYRKSCLKRSPPMLTIYEETAFDKEPDDEEDDLCRRMACLCRGGSYEMM